MYEGQYGEFICGHQGLKGLGGLTVYRKKGSVKCRLQSDCGLLFLGLENSGTIFVTYSFAW